MDAVEKNTSKWSLSSVISGEAWKVILNTVPPGILCSSLCLYSIVLWQESNVAFPYADISLSSGNGATLTQKYELVPFFSL